MPNFTAGTSFTDGVTNDVTAAKLNALVADAVPTSNLALTSTNGTIANFTASTANITLGTIPTLTAGTTTGTAGIFTSGTITTGLIPTLTTGTTTSTNEVVTNGTITNLSATTSTFLGTITGSTNVINIGSGQIYKDASGNVGIGTNNPQNPLHVASSNAIIRLQDTDTVGNGTNSIATWITFRDSANTQTGYFGFPSDPNFYVWNITNSQMLFGTNNQERLRIDASGNLLVGKTVTDMDVAGSYSEQSGRGRFTTNSGLEVLTLNRQDSDGIIVEIRQANTVEGTISVSGTTVSYNGGHLSRFSQLPSGQRDPAIKKGTVLSNLDAMCEWRDADGSLLPNEQLNKVKISDVEGDSNTAGVFVNWDNDDQDNPYDLNMAMTGDMIIRIAQGTSVNRGDLLMSAGDGTAKPQGDDIIRSKTIAKVTSTNVTCTYEDGSYCVPCVLMAC